MNICNKSQYKEASTRERFRLWLHLLYCRSCARFSLKNRKLTELCDQASLKQLSESEKEALKKCLHDQQAP